MDDGLGNRTEQHPADAAATVVAQDNQLRLGGGSQQRGARLAEGPTAVAPALVSQRRLVHCGSAARRALHSRWA
jgi:hypothetical protein